MATWTSGLLGDEIMGDEIMGFPMDDEAFLGPSSPSSLGFPPNASNTHLDSRARAMDTPPAARRIPSSLPTGSISTPVKRQNTPWNLEQRPLPQKSQSTSLPSMAPTATEIPSRPSTPRNTNPLTRFMGMIVQDRRRNKGEFDTVRERLCRIEEAIRKHDEQLKHIEMTSASLDRDLRKHDEQIKSMSDWATSVKAELSNIEEGLDDFCEQTGSS